MFSKIQIKPVIKVYLSLLLLVFFIPEVQHIENSYSFVETKQAQVISRTFKINVFDAFEIVKAVKETSALIGVNSSLLLAIIETESSFRKHASNDKGKAIGLMQVHTSSNKKVSYSIQENIFTGATIFYEFWLRTKSTNTALQMYNCGNKYKAKHCRKYMLDVRDKQKKYFL